MCWKRLSVVNSGAVTVSFIIFALVSESKADVFEKTQEHHSTKLQSKWKNRYQVLPCKYENAAELFSFPLLVFFLCLLTLCLGMQGVRRQAHTEAGEAVLFQSWTFLFYQLFNLLNNRKWLLTPHFFLIFWMSWVDSWALSKCRALSRGIVGLREGTQPLLLVPVNQDVHKSPSSVSLPRVTVACCGLNWLSDTEEQHSSVLANLSLFI